MINDVHEFKKLYSIPIPYHKEHMYYIQTLMKSPEYFWLKDAFLNFVRAESSDEGVHTIRMHFQNKLIEKIKNSEPYEKLINDDTEPYYDPIPSEGKITNNPDLVFVSLDIREANYTVLKLFGPPVTTMNWFDYCISCGMPSFLAKSKYLRQVIFGNTSPKRFRRVQQNIVADLYHEIQKKGGVTLKPVETHHDELIYGFEHFESAWAFVNLFKSEASSPFVLFKSEASSPFVLFKPTVFQLRQPSIGYDKPFVKWVYTDPARFHLKLYGVPGSRFYINFKQHVLGLPVEERDLYFVNEKQLAKWVL